MSSHSSFGLSRRVAAAAALVTGLLAGARIVPAQMAAPLDSTTRAGFKWRAIGPAIMMGRVTDIEVNPRNTKVWYVVAATGGVWKTINNGTTFFPLTDTLHVASMGDLAIAPSDPDVLYLGSGEEDARNSISPGAGMYRSRDGGKSWTFIGLRETEAIGRIVVDPRNANTVYVAAVGKTWATNPERGVYKSTDGGQTWTKSLFVSDRAGAIDLAMDPTNPDVLWASTWERIRGPYFLRSGGPGSGLWKSTDAGRSWTRITGGGLPTTTWGRVGLAVAPTNGNIIYLNLEADTLPNPKRLDRPDTLKAQKINSGIWRSADGGKSWTQTYRNTYELEQRPFYYSQVRVDTRNPDRIYWMSSVFRVSDDGGKTSRRSALSIHTDWHAMWIDPNDPDHFIIGDDGGIAVTYDKGGTFEFPNIFAIGQFYAVNFDMRTPYRICGGLQDNGSWCGPSRQISTGGIGNEDWYNVGGGDGFWTAIDPTDANIVYSESQGGNISRLDLSSNARTIVNRGGGRNRGSSFEDSLVVARGDTTKPETPEITKALAELRRRASADSAKNIRFNWNTPFFLSPHSPVTLYVGGSRVLKSSDRGDHLFPISPDLSTADSVRIIASTRNTGGITADNTGAETHGTVTALAESPIRPGILWAGTDDGNVWLTRNDGGAWENLTTRFPGLPAKPWVTRVEPSHFDTAVVYVTFDRHRDDDFRPYVYVSRDFGRTFQSMANNLPSGGIDFVHVIREDPYNRNLLFLGTDVGAYVSTNGGQRWERFMEGLPTVPVHDLKIHPRDRELIAGTHGRSIYVVDIAPLEEMMADSVARADAYFFPVTRASQYTLKSEQRWDGNKVFRAEGGSYGADLVFRLANAAKSDTARIVVTNVAGDTIRTLRAPAQSGFNRVTWDLRRNAEPLGPAARRDSIANAARSKARDDSIRAARNPADTAAKPGTDTTARGRGRGARREESAAYGAVAGPGGINLRPAEEQPGAGGRGGGGGFRGSRGGKNVDPGDYLVTITVGGKTMRRVVHVERVGAVVDNPFGDDDDGDGEHHEP